MTQTLLKTAADFESGLNVEVVAGDTTASLISTTDTDGNALADGMYGFTIDGDVSSSKEFVVAVLTGTTLSSVTSVSDQGVVTTGFAKFHRRGASAAITDWAALYRAIAVLNGTTNFDAGTHLGYDAAPVGLTGNQFATVAYVLSVVSGGTVTFDQQIVASQTAGENLNANASIYFKESDQRWYNTDADILTTVSGTSLAFALSTVTTGNSFTVLVSGVITLSALTPGAKYYVSQTAGSITASTPSAPAYERFVGWALSATKLLMAPISTVNQMSGTVGLPSSVNKFVTSQNIFSNTDQSQGTENTATAVGEANATTKKNKLAQSFIPTINNIRGVKLYKTADTGTFTGSVTVALQADSAGSPSGSNLASATISNAGWLLLAIGDVMFDFSAAYSQMVIGSTYWIVVTTSTSDNSNHPNIGLNSAGGYANGAPKYNNTTDGWVAITGQDFYFTTYGSKNGQIPVGDAITGVLPQAMLVNGLIDLDTTTTTLANSNAETTVYAKQLPASACLANAGIYIRAFYTAMGSTNSSSQPTIKVKLNGTTVATLTNSVDSGTDTVQGYWETTILNTSTTAQKYLAFIMAIISAFRVGSATTNVGAACAESSGTAAVDVSAGAMLTITYTNFNTNANTSFTHQGLTLYKVGT